MLCIDEFVIKCHTVSSEEEYSSNRELGAPIREGVPLTTLTAYGDAAASSDELLSFDLADYYELPDLWRVLYNSCRAPNTEYTLHNGSGIVLMCLCQIRERCYLPSRTNVRINIIDLGFIYTKTGCMFMLSWNRVTQHPFFWRMGLDEAYHPENLVAHYSSFEDALNCFSQL